MSLDSFFLTLKVFFIYLFIYFSLTTTDYEKKKQKGQKKEKGNVGHYAYSMNIQP